jgi:putative endonuclease
MPDEASQAEWYVYMVRCRGGMLYTGIACDVERRLREHQAGRGAKYLRGRGRLELVFRERVGTRRQALQLERAVKRLTKERKEALALSGCGLQAALGRAR